MTARSMTIRGAVWTAALICAAAAAAEPTTQTLVDSCAICHGTDGRAPRGGLDGLAGESAGEIAGEFKEMRTDPHEGRLMSIIAKGYTDAQVKAMADYFARVRSGK